MTSAVRSFQDQFRGSPALLVQMLDANRDRVLVASLSEADYRQASFLDQRILASGRPCQWLDWNELEAVAGALPDRAQFIFHIGHVGSTLVSRLLGELPTVFALREPLLLRGLAELHRIRGRPQSPWPPEAFAPRLATALGWLSRTFRAEQQPVVKATSFASELAPAIVARGRKALFLHVGPQTYMETILAGEASLQELGALAGDRLLRLHERLGESPWRLWQLSLGERVAMAWACEMTALEAGSAAGGDVLWFDFDRFLAAPAQSLARIARHFGHGLAAGAADALVGGPIMRTYSKAPEHGYSADLRRQVLAQARAEHGDELRRGLQWLAAAARAHPAIAGALDRAARKD